MIKEKADISQVTRKPVVLSPWCICNAASAVLKPLIFKGSFGWQGACGFVDRLSHKLSGFQRDYQTSLCLRYGAHQRHRRWTRHRLHRSDRMVGVHIQNTVLLGGGGRGLMWIIRGWKFQKCDSFWQQFPSLHLFIEGRKSAILEANLREEEKLYQQQFILPLYFFFITITPRAFSEDICIFSQGSLTVLAGSLPILSCRRDWFNDYSQKDC